MPAAIEPGRERVDGHVVAEYDEFILRHYRRIVLEYGLDPSSTMLDDTTRVLEQSAILASLRQLAPGANGSRVLEVGCGNGFCLTTVRDEMPSAQLVGIDFCPEMIELASERQIDSCSLSVGDVRALAFERESFDTVISQRCLINVLDLDHQGIALAEIDRVLRPGGHLILIEAFTDGLADLNRARSELGLPAHEVPEFNLWFDRSRFGAQIARRFEVGNEAGGENRGFPPRNFLSTHYFISRVVYPAITQAKIQYNTEFVRFWRFLPPMGNFSPIQLVVLRKPG